MTIERFDRYDAGYLRWRRTHEDRGFVVNEDPHHTPGGTKLHLAGCSYLQRPIDKGWHLTHYPKICSDSLQELRRIPGGETCQRCSP